MIVEYSLAVNVVDFLLVFSLDQQCSVLSCFSRVRLFATQCSGARQAPLSMGILQARILEWAAMTSSRDLPNPGIKPLSLTSLALTGRLFTTSTT